uniref:Adhesion molecule immunoglobulin-like domain-containing protein n=1 Tax=Panthera tigris altaica TaxID=74533 RepID=A0A8C9M6L3_PANTA
MDQSLCLLLPFFLGLLHRAFPAQLTVSPVALVAEQDREVACTAHNVTPVSPEALSLSLLLGDRELEGVQALGRDVEEEPQQGEDLLFRVTERWLLPPLGTPTPPTLHCQATMKLPGLELSHHQPIPGESSGFWTASLWPGSLVLGLLFLAFLTHRLWRRCRPAG